MINAILSDILVRWFHWQRIYALNRGYPSQASGCGSFLPSRQYDSENGARDNDQEIERMEVVEFEVWEMPEPGRTAIHVHARALALGLSVFRSPRLPENQVQVLEIIAEAREELTRRLMGRGVM